MRGLRALSIPVGPLATAAGVLVVAAALGRQATTENPGLVLLAASALLVAFVAFVDLTLGLLAVTALLFFELVPGFGAGDLSAIKIVGLLVTMSWFARVIDVRSRTTTLFDEYRVYPLVLIAFVAWALLSTGWAEDQGAAGGAGVRLGLVLVLTFVTFSAIREPRHLKWVLLTFVAGAFATTAYGLLGGLAIGRDDRLTGGILNPNELAGALVPAVILGVFVMPSLRSMSARLLLSAAIATCLVGLLLTQSRAAFLGFMVALAVALVVAGPMRPVVIALTVIVAVVGAAYFTGFTSPEQRERLSGISARGSSGRADEWRIALRIAGDHPVVGAGFGNYSTLVPQYIDRTPGLLAVRTLLKFPPPHNSYLQVLSELGPIGLALFLSAMFGALAIGLRSIATLARGPDRPTELAGRGLVIAFVAVLTIAVFSNSLHQKSLWLMVGLLCSLATLARLPADDDEGPALSLANADRAR